MHLNCGFVLSSLSLLFVLDPTSTHSVSASAGSEPVRFIQTIRRRSIGHESENANEEDPHHPSQVDEIIPDDPIMIESTGPEGPLEGGEISPYDRPLPTPATGTSQVEDIEPGMPVVVVSTGPEGPLEGGEISPYDRPPPIPATGFPHIIQGLPMGERKPLNSHLGSLGNLEGTTTPHLPSIAPQLGLPQPFMNRISAGLIGSIARFSAHDTFGVQLPTRTEIGIAIHEAIEHADMHSFLNVVQAIIHSIENLIDRKLAEAETSEIRSPISSISPEFHSLNPSQNQIATALLDLIEKFSHELPHTGRLPTIAEVSYELTPVLQNIDFSSLINNAKEMKSGFDQLTNNNFDVLGSHPSIENPLQEVPSI